MPTKRKYQVLTETESETDADALMGIMKQQEQLSKHKSKGADAGKKWNKIKRAVVGMWLTGWLFLPVLAGPFYHTINATFLGIFVFNELMNISRNENKDNLNRLTGPVLEWGLFWTLFYFQFPRIVLRKQVLENSGFSPAEYPTLYMILYDIRVQVTSLILTGLFLLFVGTLQRGAFRYQFRRFAFASLIAIMTSYVGCCLGALIQFGRVWALIVPMIVACNDTMAYFSGVTMGRTTLITLSPNKTLEGFVGGALFTFAFAFINIPYVFKVEWLVCPYDKFTLSPFENTTCVVN